MNLYSIIDIVLTGLSMCGGVCAWWYAHKSQTARNQAHYEAERTQALTDGVKQLIQMNTNTDNIHQALLQLNNVHRLPDFTLENKPYTMKFFLSNNTDSPATLYVVNRNEFFQSHRIPEKICLDAHATCELLLLSTFIHRLPSCLRCVNQDGEQIVLPIVKIKD